MHGYEFEPEKDRVVEKDGKLVLLIAMKLSRDRF
jgi:hypothetical protein